MAVITKLRAANGRPSWIALTAFTTMSAVAIGLTGPFGMTVSQPHVLARIAHFLVCAIGMTLLTLGAAEGLRRARPALGVWAIVIGAVLVSLPGMFLVRASLGFFSPLSVAHVTPEILLLQTAAMNVVLALLGWRVLGGVWPKGNVTAAHAATPGFAHRLPPELRTAPLLALKAEDHYLRVYTARGEALIHLRIGDAETALAEHDGIRTHRSFWIARRAFKDAIRADGRLTLTLENGLSAPVSRSRVEAVKDWLENGPA